MQTLKNRAQSCILGAMIGDSLGSTLEFTNKKDASKILKKYQNFNGGLVGKGPFNLVPGQFTDDSEVALANMSVITKIGYYDQKLVAKAYHQWYLSKPFDIGNATKAAFIKKTNEEMIKVANTVNYTSLSNGFLMRIYGLVALHYNKTRKELFHAISDDVELTHGNPEAHSIAITYGIMLWMAIHGKDASSIYQWGKKNTIHSPLISAVYQAVELELNYFDYRKQKYYFSQIDSKLCGFVGFAFWLVLLSLKDMTNYYDAIIYVVSLGGDTDTNACIVGALMGALYPDSIPNLWINDLLNCNAKKRYINYKYADPKIWSQWLP